MRDERLSAGFSATSGSLSGPHASNKQLLICQRDQVIKCRVNRIRKHRLVCGPVLKLAKRASCGAVKDVVSYDLDGTVYVAEKHATNPFVLRC